MDVIELKGVSFSYPEATKSSLSHVDLRVKKGEVLVLCGQSGCGKTTILRLINGLIPFYYPGSLEGTVTVMGHCTAGGSIYDLGSRVGTVFQNPRSQFFCVDVMSELAFGAENQKMEKAQILARIHTAAKLLDLQDLLPRTMFQLSGGEKQKIACGSVTVTDNPILVLDEPSSNLDMAAVAELKEIIRRWKSQGKTVIIAEHRLEYLKDLADRYLYLKDGSIAQSYGAEEFKQLSGQNLEARGLRTLDYTSLTLKGKESSAGRLELQEFCCQYRGAKEPSLMIQRLSIPKGAVIGIIGSNGAGKSTFVRCFCGLQKHASGVLWEAEKRYPRKARLNRSFLVMQDVNHQLFTTSVEEEITLSMGTGASENSGQLQALLKEFDLEDLGETHPMALSGGQKQRVAVASAVASGRDFIAFDEPTSGLDYVHMQQVAACILDLQSTGKTVLLITHDLELIYACCSYILHLEQGKVRESYPLHCGTEQKLRAFFLKQQNLQHPEA